MSGTFVFWGEKNVKEIEIPILKEKTCKHLCVCWVSAFVKNKHADKIMKIWIKFKMIPIENKWEQIIYTHLDTYFVLIFYDEKGKDVFIVLICLWTQELCLIIKGKFYYWPIEGNQKFHVFYHCLYCLLRMWNHLVWRAGLTPCLAICAVKSRKQMCWLIN